MDDDSSDSSQHETLDEFREKWHKELDITKHNRKQTIKNASHGSDSSGDVSNAKDQQVNKYFVLSFVGHYQFNSTISFSTVRLNHCSCKL